MRRLYIRFVLWWNGYCPKHGVRCTLCTHETVMHECAKITARETYLDKLLEEFNR